VLEIFFRLFLNYFRSVFISSTTIFLILIVTFVVRLGIVAIPLLLIACALILLTLVNSFKSFYKALKKGKSKADVIKHGIVFLSYLILIIELALNFRNFDYHGCITVEQCWLR